MNDDDDDGGGGGDTTVIVLSQVTKEEMVNESWLVMVGDGGDYDICWMECKIFFLLTQAYSRVSAS